MKLVGIDDKPLTKTILGADGEPLATIKAGPAPAPHPPWEHNPEYPTHLDYERYADWRVTKCRPRDRTSFFHTMDDANQSVHEFVGEVAELGELISQHGPDLFRQEHRARLLDEIGDIFFCGLWVMDAIRCPVFRNTAIKPGEHLGDPADYEGAVAIARIYAIGEVEKDDADLAQGVLISLAFTALTQAGMLCNQWKKVAYQGRPEKAQGMDVRVLDALAACDHILAMAGLTIADALAANVVKLDARYPEGYTATGPGGGIREGKGA